MKGLLLKDYYMFMKYCRMYLLIAAIFGVCSLNRSNIFTMAYPAVLCGITAVSLIGYDEKSRWQQFCETLPYTRKQVVTSKYMFSLILIAGLSVLFAVAHALAGIVSGQLNGMWVLDVFGLIWSVGHLFCAIILPFIFKYGSEKGRLMYIAVVVIFCVFFVSMNSIETGDIIRILNVNVGMVVAATVISTCLFVMSMLLSQHFYLKREL